VYDVVKSGLRDFDPSAWTVPTPLSMVTLVAPSTSQLSVTELPGVIVSGLAANRRMESEAGSVTLSTRSQPAATSPASNRKPAPFKRR